MSRRTREDVHAQALALARLTARHECASSPFEIALEDQLRAMYDDTLSDASGLDACMVLIAIISSGAEEAYAKRPEHCPGKIVMLSVHSAMHTIADLLLAKEDAR